MKQSNVIHNQGIAVSLERLVGLRLQAQMIDLFRHKKVMTSRSGNDISGFRGRGVEFDAVRDYQPGDDIRHMDWRVTARSGRPHTKLYREERERNVFLVVDYCASMFFGTKVAFKSVIAAELAALLAWAAVKNGDRVGGVVFSEELSFEFRPQARQRGVLSLLKNLANTPQPPSNLREPKALSQVLSKLRYLVKPGSLIFILSDFNTLDQSAILHLNQLMQHNEIVANFIYDPLEKTPPLPNHYNITDGEHIALMDTTDHAFCSQYRDYFTNKAQTLKSVLLQRNIPLMEFVTNESVYDLLLAQISGGVRDGRR